MTNVIELSPTKSDAELAQELKLELAAAYKPLIEILNRAGSLGFIVQTQLGPGPFGICIQSLDILKKF